MDRTRPELSCCAHATNTSRAREVTSPDTFSGKCGRHAARAAFSGRSPVALNLPDWNTPGKCSLRIFAVSVEGSTAPRPCTVLSRGSAYNWASIDSDFGVATRGSRCLDTQGWTSVSDDRISLVFGHARTGDRFGTGRCAVYGRSLHLHSPHRRFRRCCLERSRFGQAQV